MTSLIDNAAQSGRREGRRRTSSRQRIGWTFSLLALVLFAAVGLLSGELARRQGMRDTAALLQQLADRLAQRLDVELAQRDREIQNLAGLDGMVGVPLTPTRWRVLLQALQRSYRHYAWIGVTDAQGRVLAATGGLLEGRDVSQRDWFVQGRRQPFLGDVHEALLLSQVLPPSGRGEPLRLVDVAAPLPGGGVLGAHLQWAWAEEQRRVALRSVPTAQKVEILVVRRNGEVLLGPALPAPPPQALPGGPGGLVAKGPAPWPWSDGQRYFTAVAQSTGERDGLGWTVVVRQPQAIALAEVDALRQQLWLFGLAGAALFGGLGWWLAGRLTRPLQAVAEQARRITQTLGVPQNVRHDETTQLARSLSALLTHLQQRDNALVEMNASLEQRVQQRTAALRQANDDLESFAHSVSHDLKGPIGAMAALLQLVLAQEDPMSGYTRRSLDLLEAECRRLVKLIDALRDLAQVEQQPLAAAPVSMQTLVADVVQALRNERPDAAVQVVVDAALPPASGDPVLLRQVWHNLIGNAFKFSAGAAAPQVRISGQHDGAELVYEVADNGPGFDAAQAHRLFGAFQRLHRASDFPGSGIGLSIVKRVVHRHGGRVWAQSQPGEGARFGFALPGTALAQPGLQVLSHVQ